MSLWRLIITEEKNNAILFCLGLTVVAGDTLLARQLMIMLHYHICSQHPET